MTWGESHGPALGCVVDGCPPGLEFTRQEIQDYLDKRKPGQSKFTTQRREPDEVEILSGVWKNTTLGSPIALQVPNRDYKLERLDDLPRPRDAEPARREHPDVAREHPPPQGRGHRGDRVAHGGARAGVVSGAGHRQAPLEWTR